MNGLRACKKTHILRYLWIGYGGICTKNKTDRELVSFRGSKTGKCKKSPTGYLFPTIVLSLELGSALFMVEGSRHEVSHHTGYNFLVSINIFILILKIAFNCFLKKYPEKRWFFEKRESLKNQRSPIAIEQFAWPWHVPVSRQLNASFVIQWEGQHRRETAVNQREENRIFSEGASRAPLPVLSAVSNWCHRLQGNPTSKFH